MINHSARFTLHEFLLEIGLAVEFGYRTDPQGDYAAFRSQMLDALRLKATISDDLRDDPELALLIQDETVRLAENFFDKTQTRINGILEEMREKESQ